MATDGSTIGTSGARDDGELAAGNFTVWLGELQSARRGDRAADVPCAGCTACCTSSQFVHIAPDETDTLAHIPRALLFPAPRLPRGHVLLGYDERGHCPMLVDGACSIYDHRPRTCRTYDCRVFAASGVQPEPDEGLGRARIAARVRRWRFDFGPAADRARYDAVHAAAAFLVDHRADLPPGAVPRNETQLALAAIDLHELFLGAEAPTLATVRDALRAAT